MLSFHYAMRDEFFEMSIHCNKDSKELIKKSKEFILWAETRVEQLYDWLRKNDFESTNLEILFFKEIKPQIFSKLIFQKEILSLLINEPIGLEPSLKYYVHKLQVYVKCLKSDPKFYSYYRSDSNENDLVYFIRNAKRSVLEIDSSHLNFDSKVCTYYDTMIATILAYDTLIKYIEKRIKKIKKKIRQKKRLKENRSPLFKLHWTRNKTELIELVYALYYSKGLNNGKAELKDIARDIGLVFNLEIKDNLYRVFTDVKRRKNPNSNFIQNIADNFKKKLEEED